MGDDNCGLRRRRPRNSANNASAGDQDGGPSGHNALRFRRSQSEAYHLRTATAQVCAQPTRARAQLATPFLLAVSCPALHCRAIVGLTGARRVCLCGSVHVARHLRTREPGAVAGAVSEEAFLRQPPQQVQKAHAHGRHVRAVRRGAHGYARGQNPHRQHGRQDAQDSRCVGRHARAQRVGWQYHRREPAPAPAVPQGIHATCRCCRSSCRQNGPAQRGPTTAHRSCGLQGVLLLLLPALRLRAPGPGPMPPRQPEDEGRRTHPGSRPDQDRHGAAA